MYERIMVPLDGTSFGEHAIPFATAIARRSGAAIDLVHVHVPAHLESELFEIPAFHYTGIVRSDATYDHDHLVAEARTLEALARRLAEETGLQVTAHVVEGTVVREVEREAKAFGADLIVMSSHARAGLDRVRFGNIGEAVVRDAAVPVLLVRATDAAETAATEFKRVLVPLDGSELSEQIVGPAGGLARLFGAELHLLHVLARPEMLWLRRAASDQEGQALSVDFTADQYLEYVANEFANDLEAPVMRVFRGATALAGILETANSSSADLIAMATHGWGGLKRLLFGSTTRDLLHQTNLPVLVYRPREAAAGRTATRGTATGAQPHEG